MARRIGDRVDRRVIEAEHCHSPRAHRPDGGIDDRLQVAEHRLEREIGDVALRVARPAAVVLDELEGRAEASEGASEDGNSPLTGEVAKRQARQVDERRSMTFRRVRDRDAIGRPCRRDPRFLIHAVAGWRPPRHPSILGDRAGRGREPDRETKSA